MVSRGRRTARPGRGVPRARVWLVLGMFAGTAVALVDVVSTHDVLVTGVLLGPLVAAIGAGASEVAVVGVYCTLLALVLGAVNDIFGSGDHVGRVGVVAVTSAIAVGLAAVRQRTQSELETARPGALDAERLRLALNAGRMGTWRWDLRSGEVQWDTELEALFGLAPGAFRGSIQMYRSLLHPDDRERALRVVDENLANDRPWLVDHRVVWPDGTVHWLEGRGQPVHDESGAIVAATGVSVDIEERRKLLDAEQAARARLRTLVESSERLGELDDPDRILETICELAANRIGVWATIVRLAPDGSLERSTVRHRDPELNPVLQDVVRALDDDGTSVARVLESGEPLLVEKLTAEAYEKLARDPALRARYERVPFDAALIVPLTIAGRRLAVLSIGCVDGDRVAPADIELAVDLGRRGASALERARLWQASQDKLEAEHRIVELLQRTVVPERLPIVPGLQLAAAYRPAEVALDVGGDWYDAFTTPDGAAVLVVGDVAGHGVEAASLMGRVRNALRAYAFEDSDPGRVLVRLDRLLRSQDEHQMVTAFVARYEPATRTLAWSRAGHPPPLLVEGGEPARTRFLDDVNAAPLGAMLREYRTARTPLDPGALIVCYTDGLVERRDRVLDDGLAWLAERVREHARAPVDALCDNLVDDPFVPHPSPDDICVLAIRVDAAGAVAP